MDNASIFDLYFEPTRNLYAYYPLSFNSANDLSGNFRNGNIPNTANLNSDGGRDNRTDHGLFFNGGSNDFVSLPNGFDNFTNGLTITGWSFPTDLTLSSQRNWARIVDFGNGASSSNIIFAKWANTSGIAYHNYQTGGSTRDELEQLDYFSSGRWNFEALTQVGGNSGIPTRTRLFRNDRMTLEGNVNVPSVVNRTQNYIGKSNWTSDSPWQGSHDDIRIYQRTLQDDEVIAIYSTVDTHAPNPGNQGVVMVTNPGTITPILNWDVAEDDYTRNTNLEYLVVRNETLNRIHNEANFKKWIDSKLYS